MPTLLLAFGLLLLFSFGGFLALTDEQRNGLLYAICIRKQCLTRSSTTTRYGSTQKQIQPPNEESPRKQYCNAFPPSRRHFFSMLGPDTLQRLGKSVEDLGQDPPDYSNQVPDKTCIEEHSWANYLTPTGFTIEEISRLGDFPDYSKLSGVPLPNPYPEFDIKLAKPRPYRPLRWPFHQTMCKFRLITSWI